MSCIMCHMSCVTCHVSYVTCCLSRATCHMSRVTCHVSHVTCHMSPVTCHVSPITCHLSCVTCHLSPGPCHLSHIFCFVYYLWASWWRVCYQLGLPHLVFTGLPAAVTAIIPRVRSHLCRYWWFLFCSPQSYRFGTRLRQATWKLASIYQYSRS